MKKIKTVADVLRVPANQRIDMMNRKDNTCPFCGMHLRGEVVGFGRDKCVQYHNCSCTTAKAAAAHNTIMEALAEEKYKQDARKAAVLERKRAEKEAKKPKTATAVEIFCVATGRIFPDILPVLADDHVSLVMEHAGLKTGSAQNRLFEYAKQQGFDGDLKKAAAEMTDYLRHKPIDTSNKVKELCVKYGIPEKITL
ncbi:MAG: hypothetical protein J5896_06080 [Alphaproteobacteria bacterium]|nr:hypothetical protein [Alphaproteobacteria bacterium]